MTIIDNIDIIPSFYPDQTRHFVRHDLGPSCLQKCLPGATTRQELTTKNEYYLLQQVYNKQVVHIIRTKK